MRQWIRSHLTYANVMVTILAFILLGGVSYAATGGNFLLGKANSASTTSSLTAPVSGKALQLTNTSTAAGATALGANVASGHPPFTVNSGTKVTNLNADKLDGIDSTGFLSSGSVKSLIFEDAASPSLTYTDFATVGPYTLKAGCVDTGTVLYLSYDVNGPTGTVDYFEDQGTNDSSYSHASGRLPIPASTNTPIGTGFTTAIDGNTGRTVGTVMLKTGSVVIQVDYDAVVNNPPGSGGENCYLYGTAFKGT